MNPLLFAPLLAAPDAVPSDGVWPLQPRPRIARAYTPPPKPWLPGHRGLDLFGSPGQQVLAPTEGTVTYAGPLAGRGVVVLTHGDLRTTYEPVIPSVEPGARVRRAQPIGRLSAAASHCAPTPCLHWGLRRDAAYLDPQVLLKALPVRLLPTVPALTAGGSVPGPAASAPPPPPSTAPAPAAGSHGTAAPTAIVTLSALATLGAVVLIRNH
ncbi:M23 family metallopeptidase [Kribbella flavida]|nr:M23 family metallopeptidase [Kribbella flavida]